MERPALFLDRDGVINEYEPYVVCKERFRFIDGIFELVREAQDAGYLIVVVTNQSAIGRGLCTEDDFRELTRWMIARFAEQRCRIDGVYHCPTHPEHGIGKYRIESDMRKPRPGMILKAASDLGVDLERSLLIGDSLSDVEAGLAAGVGRIFRLGSHEQPLGGGYVVVERLLDIVPFLRA